MTSHALVLGASPAVSQPPHWLYVAQATGAVATTIGVLVALYIAVVREPRKDASERRHHAAQIDALHRAERERVAAQARKVVPSYVRTPMFGDSWWTVRIDNASNAMTTLLAVEVTALDTNGFEIIGGCRQANNTMSVDQVFDQTIRAALSDMSGSGFERQLVPAFKHAIRDAIVGHLVSEWPHTLPPNQHAVMAYTTTDPNFRLRVTIDYEDEAGYQWQRTDTSQPSRTDEEVPIGLIPTSAPPGPLPALTDDRFINPPSQKRPWRPDPHTRNLLSPRRRMMVQSDSVHTVSGTRQD